MASRQTDRDIGIRVAPNLIFSYPAGAGFSRIWNCNGKDFGCIAYCSQISYYLMHNKAVSIQYTHICKDRSLLQETYKKAS